MDATTAIRPYFFPADIDFATLPEEVKLAVETLIEPLYQQLVLEAEDPLERAAGSSLVCLMVLELLDQFELGQLMRPGNQDEQADRDQRDQLTARYLRLVGGKQKTTDLILRIRNYHAKHGSLAADLAG